MKAASDLRLLALAVIQHNPGANLTRYQVMTKINHLISEITPPYSPGAVYHELKLLQREKMIIIDHISKVSITEPGTIFLRETLLSAPIPSPLLSSLIRIAATLMLNNETDKLEGLKKCQIELIKYSQISASSERRKQYKYDSPIIELTQLVFAIRKSVSSFVAGL